MDGDILLGGPSMAKGVLECIESCSDCYGVCMETSVHCVGRGGAHAEGERVRLLEDCAQIVQLCGNLMLRGSELAASAALLCLAACERCARDCE
jgi:hypothetical protein